MLRLTLRTLLAYLDDTLAPGQARDIGKKVAESEVAQKTVERIKTVTRRRRLSAPTIETTDHSTEPNTIAEYLDNVLVSDQVTELEQAALENDTKLAEIAACHQILTLVLGEPASVPPTARRRMYRLVKGPEAIPYRKPSVTAVAGIAAPAVVDEYHDDDPLESLLGSRNVLWMVALLVAIGLLAVSVWLAVPAAPPAGQGYVALAPIPPRTENPPAVNDKKPEVPEEKKIEPPVENKKDEVPATVGPAPRVVPPAVAPTVKVADSERRALAAFDSPSQPLLVRKRDTNRWDKVLIAEPKLSTTDALLGLPGFHPDLQLDSGVRLQLWGNSPDALQVPIAESRVILHVPPQGLDADLTLQAGRIFLSSPKTQAPVNVRVRFRDEVWDITLADARTEVGIDLIGEPAKGAVDADFPESPRAIVYLGVVTGSASVRSGFAESGPLGEGSKFKWDSKGGKAAVVGKDDPDDSAGANRWRRDLPIPKDVTAAVNELAKLVGMTGGQFDIDFDATWKAPNEPTGRRVLAVWMLAALDNQSYLINALDSESAAVRNAAVAASRHWVALAPGRDAEYANVLSTKGAFSDVQRTQAIGLVRTSESASADAFDRLFDLLKSDRLAIRELARFNLAKLDPAGAKESNYDAGTAPERRDMQLAAWQRAIKKLRDVKAK